MMCGKLTSLDSTFDLDELVLKTPGYVGADLSALIDEALVAALNRYEFILNSMISIVICFI
jgi:SpoVK/Ycf46/Vps4 family AAA+-type ATPase